MRTCVISGCSRSEDITDGGGKSPYCIFHFRSRKMYYGARKRHKWCPDIEALVSIIQADRCCPHCGKIMGLFPSNGNKGDTASLQHYKDGTIGVICHSCNTRDGLSRGQYRGAIKALIERG